MLKMSMIKLALRVFCFLGLVLSFAAEAFPAQALSETGLVPGRAVEFAQGTIVGNSVIYADSNVYLQATPHTLYSSGWVTLQYKLANYSGDVDIVAGFNDSRLAVAKTETLETVIAETENIVIESKSFDPDVIVSETSSDNVSAPDADINAKVAKIQYVDNGVSGNITLAYTVKSGNTYISNSRKKQVTLQSRQDWKQAGNLKQTALIYHANAYKWQSSAVQKSTARENYYTAKVWIEVPFNGGNKVSGKYNIGIKPASLSIENAKYAGQLWIIDPWYNSSWPYRKRITVTHTDDFASDTLYQVPFSIGKSSSASGEQFDLADHCNDNFTDIRFTKADGNTLLPFYRESPLTGSGSSTLAKVWCNMTVSAAPVDTDIYIYYGNAGASDASSGADTFTFFDDFNTDLSKWTGDTVYASVAGSVMTMTYTGTAPGWTLVTMYSTTTAQYKRCRMRADHNSYNGSGGEALYNGWNNGSQSRSCSAHSFTDAHYMFRTYGSSSYTDVDTGIAVGAGSYHLYQIDRISSASANLTIDANAPVNTTTNIPTESLAVGFTCQNLNAGSYTTIMKCDWIFISSLTAIEPVFGSAGSEEMQNPPTVITGACTGQDNSWLIFNGNITDNGSSAVTTRGFDYGLTDAYGSSVTETSVTGFGTGNFNGYASGLTASTIYHYRAKAYNGQWGYGADKQASTTGSPVIEYYFQTAADNQSDIYGLNWAAQTFTTDNTTPRTVTSIRLLLDRVGSPGTITVSLRSVSGGLPTGTDIVSGTIDGDAISTTAAWYQIDMTTEKSLNINTQYAICVRALDGDGSNYIQWKYVNAGGYTGGTGVTSVNGGLAWTAQTWDYNFELWGNLALDIQDAKVFTGYKEAGDWLIVIRYLNVTAPYYDTYDIKKYFVAQLVDTGTVKAQSSLTSWGNKVANIYLSAAQVSSLTYGGSYYIRLYGTFTGNPYTEYLLQATDWLGDDLTQLDSWVITSASVIGTYYNQVLTTYIADRGEVLNNTGGTIFSNGINGLSIERPNIFQIYTIPTSHADTSTTQTYRQTLLNWEDNWGTDGTLMLERIETALGVDAGLVGGLLFVAMMMILGLLAFPAGHTTAANILSIPCLAIGIVFGLDIIYLIILGLFAAFLLFKNQFMDK